MSKEMRTLLMGMSGQFSHIVLERLLAHSFDVVAILVAGPRNVPLRVVIPAGGNTLPHWRRELELPLLNPTVALAPVAREKTSVNRGRGRHDSALYSVQVPASPLARAVTEGIPVFECGKVGHVTTTSWLKALDLDVVCVACWNSIVPPDVLDIPRFGFLNVHPSLLPAYRGPFPLFWQFRMGETAMGVTVHWMDDGLDTGDIAGQREIQFEDGVRGAEAEALCAKSGGDLLAKVLGRLSRGVEMRRPQPSGGSYYPAPSRADFTLESSWHPRRAFNFMRATAEWGIPFSLEAEGKVYRLSDAVNWREKARPKHQEGGKIWASFRGGRVLAEKWSEEAP